MKRLTKKSDSGMVWFVDHENNDIKLEPCEMNSHHNRLAIQKLAVYEDAEEQGLFWKFPCKVGDILYILMIIGVEDKKLKYEVFEAKVLKITIDSFHVCFLTETTKDKYKNEFTMNAFGEVVFLTKEEAEQALTKINSK